MTMDVEGGAPVALYAISDLHLGTALGKTMDRFGEAWFQHELRLRQQWAETVSEQDTVLMPGDLSWAMRWPDFIPDLEMIASLPGHKVISRGNHDYYWQSKTKMRAVLPSGFTVLDQSAAICASYAVAAVKGWLTPGAAVYRAEVDEKYFLRERARLELALAEAKTLDLPIIVQMHYPPWAGAADRGFSDILESFAVRLCVYGHLHSGAWQEQQGGWRGGVRYQLVSADYLGFKPLALDALLKDEL